MRSPGFLPARPQVGRKLSRHPQGRRPESQARPRGWHLLPMTAADPPQPRLLRTTSAHVPHPMVAERIRRSPKTLRLRRSAYVTAEEWQSLRPEAQHRLCVEAAAGAGGQERVFSHESAAVLLGLPVIGGFPERAHTVQLSSSGGRSSGLLVRHGVKTMPPSVVVDGIRVTAPARTAVDLARTRTFASGLAATDYALHNELCTREELIAELEALRGCRDRRQALAVVERADGATESVGESLSRARMYELGLPTPELQVRIYDDDGFVGRVDFLWRELGVIAEFDGHLKYRADGLSAESAADTVWREKLREDRLRALGYTVVRLIWNDAWETWRLERALASVGVTPIRRPSPPSAPVARERASDKHP